jgi:molybdopterin molybdotransferase
MLLDHAHAVDTQAIPLADASGRVLAQTVRADRPSPACDVSAMDGYALRTADLDHTTTLTLAIIADAPPGTKPPPMPPAPGTLRIMTGSPIPPGVDLVIKREDTTEHPDPHTNKQSITIEPDVLQSLAPGNHIRRQGENIAADTIVAQPGVEISPTRAGMLSLFGHTAVTVHRKVRTAIITTGDEVLPTQATPTPYQLRDSNSPALAAMLASKPWLDPAPPTHANDTPKHIAAAIRDALAHADLLFLTGGVSMGDRDHVPAVLRDLGANILFHKLPQRPGKPALAARMPDGQLVLALPGNPVSVCVTARRLGSPVLRHLAGLIAPEPDRLVTLDQHDGKSLELWWHRLVQLLPDGCARLVATVGSGDLVSAARADGFIEVPPTDTSDDALNHNDAANRQYPFRPWTL